MPTKETVIDATANLLEDIAHTEHDCYGAIARVEDNIVTAKIREATNDTIWNRQQLRLLQAVLELLRKPV